MIKVPRFRPFTNSYITTVTTPLRITADLLRVALRLRLSPDAVFNGARFFSPFESCGIEGQFECSDILGNALVSSYWHVYAALPA
jgi:hypothetical protein